MVGGSQLFDHTKYPYWTPPQVPSDRRNIHYWTWYLHKILPEGQCVKQTLWNHSAHQKLRRLYHRRVEHCQIWPWIRYAEREKDSIKYQLINHKTEFLHRDTIETSIVPLTDWYLSELDEEKKLYPPLDQWKFKRRSRQC